MLVDTSLYLFYFGGKTHPRLLGAKDIEAFLSHLATEGKVSASTQRQALNALVFLYKNVLDIHLEEAITPARNKPSIDKRVGCHTLHSP